MQIAITGDWHIGNSRGTYLVGDKTNREIDLEKQIDIIVKYCSDYTIPIVIVAGDIFERSYVDGYWFSKALSYLRRFTRIGIDVIVMPGNHDSVGSKVPITEPFSKLKEDGISVIEKPGIFSLDDGMGKSVEVFFIPHVNKSEFPKGSFTEYIKPLLSKYKGKIIIGHFQPTGFVLGSEQEMFAGSSRIINSNIFNSKVVICNHIHKPQSKDNIHNVGSPVKFYMDERKEDKRFIILNTKDNKIKSIPLKCQSMHKINIDLVNKDHFTIPEDKLKKYKNSILGIEVNITKENRAKFSWNELVDKFNEVGAHISSRKMNTEKSPVLKKSKKSGVNYSQVFDNVLKKVVKEENKRKRVGTLGLKILDNMRSETDDK